MSAPNAADQLMAEVKALVRNEIVSGLAPIVRQIAQAAAALESALAGAGAPRRRGRPRRSAAVEPVAKAPKRRGRRGAGKGKRNPRGALQAEILSALKAGGGSLSLAEIRNKVIGSSMFRGRDPKTLYTQIVQAVKRIAGVRKTASGSYALGAKRGPKKKG